eukprot:TRINITY_DN36513_c1_g1_i1.p2 TRINITY_DN36513_c1_g1~~TRINITY_DN36513_c1_g1_i1.p2  ORF type:complete len:157 (-),score=35.49 TRINITY_DN36513_c1_g1_i1:16-486(-)
MGSGPMGRWMGLMMDRWVGADYEQGLQNLKAVVEQQSVWKTAMARPHMTLTVVTSDDGFIARRRDEPPQVWASGEEQDRFFADVEAADWAVMGRNTHLAANKPDRRRIIFSTTVEGWQRPSQLWVDPVGLNVEDLPPLVSRVRPFRRGLFLGGAAG